MPRIANPCTRALLFALLLFFPSYSIKLVVIPNMPILNEDLILSKKQKVSVSNKERKPSTKKKELRWEKNLKSFYGNSIVELDGFALSKYDVYKEFYEALYNLAEDKNPGSGNEVINKYIKILMDENKDLEHAKKETWKIYKEEEKSLNANIALEKRTFKSDAVKSENIRKAKHYFLEMMYGTGGLFDNFKDKRTSISRERSYKALEIFDEYDLEVEELFAYYNERWQEEYGLQNFEDIIYDVKIQTLKNIPNFYLSFSQSAFDLYLD
jgi:hypothetical protein